MQDKQQNSSSVAAFVVLVIIAVIFREPILSVFAFDSSYRSNKSIEYSEKSNNEKQYYGIDISNFNPVDEEFFAELKACGGKFALIRFGTAEMGFNNGCINDYTQYANEKAELCRKYGIYYGYYFLTDVTTDKEMEEQLEFIKNFISSDKSKYHAFPITLDHETRGGESATSANKRLEYIAKMSRTLQEEGYDTWIYLSEYSYHIAQQHDFYPIQKFWVANYGANDSNTPPEKRANKLDGYPANIEVWQYTSNGEINAERGINYYGRIDRNLMPKSVYEKYTD